MEEYMSELKIKEINMVSTSNFSDQQIKTDSRLTVLNLIKVKNLSVNQEKVLRLRFGFS
jgi:hypothetical protein